MTAAKVAHPGVDRTFLPVGRTVASRGHVHAVLDQPITIGGQGPLCPIDREAGEALCGLPGEYEAPPEGLFPPRITCPRCAATARAEGIEITGGRQ